MEISSSRKKALVVSLGFSFWFFVLTVAGGIFSLVYFTIFIIAIFLIMQFLAVKVEYALNKFTIFNTKIFLGILFLTAFSLYGIFLRSLRVDLLRLKKMEDTYWLEKQTFPGDSVLKQY